jgi:hypothetical protein
MLGMTAGGRMAPQIGNAPMAEIMQVIEDQFSRSSHVPQYPTDSPALLAYIGWIPFKKKHR